MNTLSKLLLITASPPGDSGVGQIIVKEICRHYPQDQIVCFAPISRHETYQKPAEFADISVTLAERRYEHGFHRIRGPLGFPLTLAAYHGLYKRHCRSLIDQAITLGKQHQCEGVFSILESATNFDITAPIANALNLPKRVLVWDAPEFIAQQGGQIPLNLKTTLRAFDSAVRDSDSMAVVSDPMHRVYKERYGYDSIILRHATEPARESFRRSPDIDSDQGIVIGFAGSVSARPQLDVLQRALDSLGWKIGDRDVRLDLYGMKFVLESRGPRNVRYCGYHTVAETTSALATSADILFMPQPFDDASAAFTQLSFPTKLSTYFAAGRPVFLLSPEGSSLGEFFSTHPFGVWCKEMNPDSVVDKLQELACDAELQKRSIKVIAELLQTQFNLNHFRTQLHRFLCPQSTSA